MEFDASRTNPDSGPRVVRLPESFMSFLCEVLSSNRYLSQHIDRSFGTAREDLIVRAHELVLPLWTTRTT